MTQTPVETGLTLISHKLCPFVQRAVIVLAEKGVHHERVVIDLADKPAWFLELSPTGKVPVLKVGETVLFESSVICEYLDETHAPQLHPSDPLERARHRAWIEFASDLMGAVFNAYLAADRDAFAGQRAQAQAKVEVLDRALGGGPFFAGHRFHLLDAVYAPLLRYLDIIDPVLGEPLVSAGSGFDAWRTALRERPSVRDAVAADYGASLRAFAKARGSYLEKA